MVTLTDDQAAALRAIRTWYATPHGPQEFYLAGYAGTGKSTVAAIAARDLNVRYIAACLTGKAAHVLQRKGLPAQTVHSLIYRPVPNNGNGHRVRFELNPDSPLADANLLLLDESSLFPHEVISDLRGFRKKILVLGDPGQLPPISGESPFLNRKPDYFFREVHRQASESPILRLATQARLGEPLPAVSFEEHNELGSVIIRRANLKDVLRPTYQTLCGVHRVRRDVTRQIRSNQGHGSLYPEPGERVLCTRNDQEEGLYNGMMGTVIDEPQLTHTGRHLRVGIHLDGEAHPRRFLTSTSAFLDYDRPPTVGSRVRELGVAQFDYGHVITVHKFQGSEADDVVLIDDSASFRENARAWLYTGITRAAQNLILLRR